MHSSELELGLHTHTRRETGIADCISKSLPIVELSCISNQNAGRGDNKLHDAAPEWAAKDR